MSKVIRTVKNVTKGYSSTQVKVRNATSNDPWGPTGTEMSEIAALTFDTGHDFFEIMDMLDKRLNDKGKNWRHVLKALKVLDYCLHEGSEHVVVWAKDNIYIIKTLREFQYVDEEGRDQGLNVRISAKELTSLINDEDRLRSERKDRRSWKSRVTGIEDSASSDGYAYHREPPNRRRDNRPATQRSRADEEDVEYRLAIEASKNQAEEDRKRNENKSSEVDDELEKAIRLSKEEEEARQRELEQANANLLFDDAASQPQPQQPYQQQPQYQQDYQQLGQVDFFGNPMGQQSTGYLANVYSQPTGYMQQQQQYPQQMYSQPTGYEQIAYLNPMAAQATGYNGNPYATTQSLSPQHTSVYLQPGDNNPYANNYKTPQPLQPLPTGSNNPFAPKVNTPQSPPRTAPSLSTLQQQQQQQYYSQQNSSFGRFSSPGVLPQQQSDNKPVNPQHAHLETLLAAGGDGMDTFGNVGNLRIPSQHTAPGTFVNSAGHGRRPVQETTGNNPFFSQQFAGVPQSTGFTNNLQSQPNRLVPAHTGPAGLNGYGGYQQQSNPFGQPQQQQQQSAGNLIDL